VIFPEPETSKGGWPEAAFNSRHLCQTDSAQDEFDRIRKGTLSDESRHNLPSTLLTRQVLMFGREALLASKQCCMMQCYLALHCQRGVLLWNQSCKNIYYIALRKLKKKDVNEENSAAQKFGRTNGSVAVLSDPRLRRQLFSSTRDVIPQPELHGRMSRPLQVVECKDFVEDISMQYDSLV
jgi:hypothetical protein